VRTGADARPISPLIYGLNPINASCGEEHARFALCRLGGNPWSTYNWETNASNSGNDPAASDPGCFRNDAALGASDVPGAGVMETLQVAQAASATMLVTLPVLDYAAADKLGEGTTGCDGDVRNSTDYLTTRFVQNRARKGAAFSLVPDLTDGVVSQDEFVAFLKDSAPGATLIFGLDNEPGLWATTHAPIHPDAATYAEVVARSVEYATMLRDAWNEAEVSAFVGYGWLDFLSLQGAPDSAQNGDFVEYYLQAMSDASDTAGERLIDYLDVHWYPEVYDESVRVIGNGVTPALVEGRVQVSRSLWDTTYVEDTWIGNSILQPIALIPRLLAKIEQSFPGTKLSISEWTYGGGTHPSGAVAAADALGAFGRNGVALAGFRSRADDDAYILGAFRAFRDYDGQGASFGDVSVYAASNDPATASVYASVASNDPNRVVIIAINRRDTEKEALIVLEHASAFTTAQVYVIADGSPIPAPAASLTADPANRFTYALPAYSVSVIVPGP
jgi:hypothetical protein